MIESKTMGLSEGENVFDVTVIIPDKTTKTYTLTVAHFPSQNADLTSLDISGYEVSPVFNKDVTDYTAILSCENAEVVVNAIPEDPNYHNLEIIKPVNFPGGEPTPVTISVWAEDTVTKKTYSVTTTRYGSTDLASAIINDAINIELKKGVLEYYVNVPTEVSVVALKLTPADNAARVLRSDTSFLSPGETVDKLIEVDSYPLGFTKNYMFHITRFAS
jgi:hypothetical protein